MSTPTSLVLSNRYFTMSSGSSVQSITGALIELITNSLDAYATTIVKNVWLQVIYGTTANNYIVIDNACGMSYSDMTQKLMVVGNYTATTNSRGVYSTGAKDCASLGDISFTSIKDGYISAITISSISTGANITVNLQDQVVCEAQRQQYNIPINGTYVQLTVPTYLASYTISQLYNMLCYNYFLRLILTDSNNVITLSDNITFTQQLTYTFPVGKPVVQASYNVPGYNALATITINVTDTSIVYNPINPPDKDCRQWGILVTSQEKSIYDNNFLYYEGDQSIIDFTWDPNARYVYGQLQCSYIDQILMDGCNGNFNITNPFLIYSPSRKGGLNINHPFTKALYTTGYNYLSVIIAKLQDRRDQGLLSNDSTLSSLMSSLNNFMSQLVNPPTDIYRFRTPQDNNNIIQAVVNSVQTNLDSTFLGISYDQIMALNSGQSIPIVHEQIPNTGGQISILFSNDKNMQAPYQILHGNTLTLKINSNDPLISPYLTVTATTVSLLNPGKALVAVANIISEATAILQVRQNILKGNSSISTQALNDYLAESINNKINNANSLASIVNTMISSIKSGTTPTTLV